MLVVVVEPEAELSSVLGFVLWREGYAVTTLSSAAETEAVLAERQPEVLILDLDLPDGEGLTLCRRLRGGSALPIIALGRPRNVDDVVQALEAGADDYLPKPFHHRELLARLHALLRRVGVPRPMVRRCPRSGLLLDDERREVVLGSRRVSLSRIEFRLLAHLIAHTQHVVSAAELLQSVWERSEDDNTDLVRVSVYRLRRKLAQIGLAQDAIRVVPGVGFAFDGVAAPHSAVAPAKEDALLASARISSGVGDRA